MAVATATNPYDELLKTTNIELQRLVKQTENPSLSSAERLMVMTATAEQLHELVKASYNEILSLRAQLMMLRKERQQKQQSSVDSKSS